MSDKTWNMPVLFVVEGVLEVKWRDLPDGDVSKAFSLARYTLPCDEVRRFDVSSGLEPYVGKRIRLKVEILDE